MHQIIQYICIALLAALWLFVTVKMVVKLVRNKYAPVKTVKAQVVDKFKADKFTKINGPAAKREIYYVVFSAGGKKRSFRVSEFSYDGYRVNEKGTLKY